MNTSERSAMVDDIRRKFESLDLNYDQEFRTELLSNKFLNIVHDYMQENDLSRKDLAAMIGTSPSYITQLFNNTRIINLSTIAKIEIALDLKFNVVAGEPVDWRMYGTPITTQQAAFFPAFFKGEDWSEVVDDKVFAVAVDNDYQDESYESDVSTVDETCDDESDENLPPIIKMVA